MERIASYSRPGDVPRQQHRPLHPRGPQHLQRRRPVVRDRRPDRLAAEGDGVERVLLAGQELLQQPDLAGVVLRGGQPGVEVAVGVEPEGRLRPGPVRRLGHQRAADQVPEGGRLLGPAHQLVTGTRHAGRAPAPTSSATCPGRWSRRPPTCPRCRARRGPGRAAPAAAPARRSAARPDRAGRDRPRTASAICCGSRASATCQCPASASRSSGDRSSGGSVVITPAVRPGSRAADSTNLDGGLQQVRCDERGDDHGREPSGTAPGIARGWDDRVSPCLRPRRRPHR